tara:strand:- start:2206 stop:2784 length:579 start_codon:yes stop_codon:yes gene_type:complete
MLLSSFLSGAKLTKQPAFVTVNQPQHKEKLVGSSLPIKTKPIKMTKKLLKDIYLERFNYSENGTLGVLKTKEGKKICLTLEEPWKDNQNFISCIPEGFYKCTRYNSPKLIKAGKEDVEVILLEYVKGRSAVQIHIGNTVDDIEGCILTGDFMLKDFTHKGKKYDFFLSSSVKAFKNLKAITEPKFYLTIKSV